MDPHELNLEITKKQLQEENRLNEETSKKNSEEERGEKRKLEEKTEEKFGDNSGNKLTAKGSGDLINDPNKVKETMERNMSDDKGSKNLTTKGDLNEVKSKRNELPEDPTALLPDEISDDNGNASSVDDLKSLVNAMVVSEDESEKTQNQSMKKELSGKTSSTSTRRIILKEEDKEEKTEHEMTTRRTSNQTKGSTLTSLASFFSRNPTNTGIFRSAPKIISFRMDYVIDRFKVGHVDFYIKLKYEDFIWGVHTHRQQLIEFHASLKRMKMRQNISGCCPRPKQEVLESQLDEPIVANSNAQTTHVRGGEIGREIHFPRALLLRGDRTNFSVTLDEEEVNKKVTDDDAKSIQNAKSVIYYLTRILEDETVRNLPHTYELLRVSELSFKQELGTSVLEGWVKMKKQVTSFSSITWHTCRPLCFICTCAVVPIHSPIRKKLWVVIKPSCAIFIPKPTDPSPIHVMLFDSSYEIVKSFSITGGRKLLFLNSNIWIADMKLQSEKEKKLWGNILTRSPNINSWENDDHPNRSFAPLRDEATCFAKPLVDGRDYFIEVADAMEKSTKEIYISGWWVTPDLPLKRNTPEGNDHWKLSNILIRKAREGVKVYVLMYSEITIAMSLNSKFQETRLANNPNIFILRHPVFGLTTQNSWYWSHHEKVVVCDGVKAFTGGIDLCWGRYDDDSHRLVDNSLVEVFPGIDFYNPRICDIADPKQFEKCLLSESEPRMPWHDIACVIAGPPARDLARHFIHQWNHGIQSKTGSRYDLPLLIPKDFPAFSPNADEGFSRVKCQILRSLPNWSGGKENGDECSIQNAFIGAIGDAQRYIYIENQFFISGQLNDSLISNRIANALYQRICKAAAEKKNFKVFIFLPLLPAFEGDVDANGTSQSALRQVLYWQYRSICREDYGRSLLQLLESSEDIEDPSEYVNFFSLRTFDISHMSAENQDAKPLTEMIYIHSKMMIIDDHVAFIGSANINDRSMSGKRDSEICVKIVDQVFNRGAKLDGADWPQSGSFAHSLRIKLFQEHFGEHLDYEVLDDFLLDKHYKLLKNLAKKNTEYYEKVFACIPSDNVKTFLDLKKRNDALAHKAPNGGDKTYDNEEELIEDALMTPGKLKRLQSFGSVDAQGEGLKEKIAFLHKIQGHAVEFPLKFLCEAKKLKPPTGIVGDIVYT